MSVHEDINGKISAKRKWARVLIISGLIMTWLSWLVWVITVLAKYEDIAQIPNELIYAQLGAGFGAIGLTLGEKLTRKNN